MSNDIHDRTIAIDVPRPPSPRPPPPPGGSPIPAVGSAARKSVTSSGPLEFVDVFQTGLPFAAHNFAGREASIIRPRRRHRSQVSGGLRRAIGYARPKVFHQIAERRLRCGARLGTDRADLSEKAA